MWLASVPHARNVTITGRGRPVGHRLPWLRDMAVELQCDEWMDGVRGRGSHIVYADCEPVFGIFPSYRVTGNLVGGIGWDRVIETFPELATLDRVYHRDQDLFRLGPPGVIQLWAWWNLEGGKWLFHRTAARLGFLDGDQSVRLSHWSWTWRFWSSSHAIWNRGRLMTVNGPETARERFRRAKCRVLGHKRPTDHQWYKGPWRCGRCGDGHQWP